ncbi:hypothetical protein [Ruicaihuangia caeni]|uniref:PilZ domain-containing protein n=1 Tax=Ruicaihuangia caeni TaxID=3042517 RepID=A0AAW6T5Y3_9MICO|nr:hypothetical protein [Klugiella sp. YN-L-19]MDI2097568.1 hypothetical protein [Klugiella sp. YN-L-19]
MFTPLRPVDPELAYAVPFVVERARTPVFELLNTSEEPARAVMLSLIGDGRLVSGMPTTLEPGARLSFALHGDDVARGSVVIVRWFRTDGCEYLWRIAF